MAVDYLLHSSACTMQLAFTFCLNHKADGACLSAEPRIVNVVSSTILEFGVL